MNQEKVGKIIKELRIKNKLTQKEFAEKFGVTYQAVSKWETGKNLPDINILKEICLEYNILIDEVINGEVVEKQEEKVELEVVSENIKKNNKNIFVGLILTFLVVVILGGVIVFLNREEDFQFKTLSSTCSNFKVSGSIAYNDSKSSIYISHVDYCGGNDDNKYESLKCTLYEVDRDIKKEISKYDYLEEEDITLEEFLSNVTFKVDNYSKVCREYQEDSFIMEVDAMNEIGEITSYKIPLKINDDCST